MQRLRNIRQLGLAYLVFPGAEHSRFVHALGVMFLAGRVYDALAAKDQPLLDPDPRCPARRVLRAATLLHDIGHAPFSHTAEHLFEGDIDHEAMTARLLRTPEIEQAFARHGEGIGLEAVERVIGGRPIGDVEGLLVRILSGELDVDKMDYLLRDSLFCGVHYGTFDQERVLDVLVPLRDPQSGALGLGIEEGGVHAVEALVLARYYMFTQVYYHVTGKVLELHLNAWLREAGVRWSNDPAEFLAQDDVWVHERLRRSDSRHARALLDRDRFVLAHETAEHQSELESQSFKQRLKPLQDRFGNQLLDVLSRKDPHKLEQSRVLVRRSGGELVPLIDASHFIRHLTTINTHRVYCEPAIQAEVAAVLRGG
jgi:hypothetical protein